MNGEQSIYSPIDVSGNVHGQIKDCKQKKIIRIIQLKWEYANFYHCVDLILAYLTRQIINQNYIRLI